MGALEFRHFFGFENFGPVISLGRLKVCPNEHPYLKFIECPPGDKIVKLFLYQD